MGLVRHKIKRCIVALTVLSAAGMTAALTTAAAHAQVPFHLLRPAAGAHVRETVRFQFSRAALGDVRYIQFVLDGRFMSAIGIPPPSPKGVYTDQVEAGADRVSLLWNTKAIDKTPGLSDDQRTVQDGPHTIQMIGEDDSGRRVGADSVTVVVANHADLYAPADGVAMDYHFSLGDVTHYIEKTSVTFIAAANQTTGTFGQRAYYGGPIIGAEYDNNDNGGGQNGNDSGDSNPIIPVQTVRATFERTTEDYLGGNAFFIRDKVLGGAIQSGNGSAARLQDVYDFKSRYRTVDITGDVRDSGKASRPGAYVALLLPNIGGGRRRVGNTWRTQTPIQLEWATMDPPPLVYADNTFEGLEWQDGYQTARIRQKYDGTVDMPIFGGASVIKGAKVSMDRVIWFAYQAGKIVRMETSVKVEGDAAQSVIGSMVPSAGLAAGPIGGGGMNGPPGGGFNGPPGGGFNGPPGGGMNGPPGGFMGGPPGGYRGGPPGGFPGGGQGGFGAAQGPGQAETLVPSKFESVSVVTLDHTPLPTAAHQARVAQTPGSTSLRAD
jgi:hypothetical protein